MISLWLADAGAVATGCQNSQIMHLSNSDPPVTLDPARIFQLVAKLKSNCEMTQMPRCLARVEYHA